MRWAERWHRLRGETDALERRVAGKTSSIARTFDRVCVVLDALGYLDGDAVPTAGESLARVYSESDLLAVESLRAGLWDALSPAELAAVVSSLVYTSRRADESNPVVPSGPVQTALTEMDRLWGRLAELERDAPPAAGAPTQAYAIKPDPEAAQPRPFTPTATMSRGRSRRGRLLAVAAVAALLAGTGAVVALSGSDSGDSGGGGGDRAAARDAGLGVVFITHNPHHAYLVGNHFIILKLGQAVLDKKRSEVTLDELTRQMAGGDELTELSHELQR